MMNSIITKHLIRCSIRAVNTSTGYSYFESTTPNIIYLRCNAEDAVVLHEYYHARQYMRCGNSRYRSRGYLEFKAEQFALRVLKRISPDEYEKRQECLNNFYCCEISNMQYEHIVSLEMLKKHNFI